MEQISKDDKSQFERMINGELYHCMTNDLIERRHRAKVLCHTFNNELGNSLDQQAKEEVLGKLFGKVGSNCTIEAPLRVDYGVNIEIGNNFYSNFDLVILDCSKVKIGDNVQIGPGCHLYAATHPLDEETRCKKGLEFSKPVTIGNNVWLGGKVIVLPGVSIGDGCVIGAGSVVTKDIPTYSLAVGNPCRVIRSIS